MIPIDTRRTREAWLEAAIDQFRPRFEEVGYPLPEKIHVSVGFGTGVRGENKTILGATWARFVSEDDVNHMFISPVAGDTAEVLRILLHELIHATLDCQDGHEGRFAEIATRLGFTGPMTTTPASIELAAEFMVLAAELGEYPHGRLDVDRAKLDIPVGPDGKPVAKPHTGPPTQRTKYLKVECPQDGYIARVTAKWLKQGHPLCGICGAMMV
jgi:hypothetical protein